MAAFPKLVLSLGVPRSGTTFVFNALRELWSARGVAFKAINANYAETSAFLRRYSFTRPVLLHAHSVEPEVRQVLERPDVRAFFNYRDPRDVVVSLMKLHDYTFEQCLRLAEISFAQYRAARRFASVMFIAYASVVGEPARVIEEVADRMGIRASAAEIARVSEVTSLEAHRRVMQAVAAEQVPVQIRPNPRRMLKESATHFITDRHIQSGIDGRWRYELSAEQQEITRRRFGPLLAELGYERPLPDSG
jgi:hypothetical protein